MPSHHHSFCNDRRSIPVRTPFFCALDVSMRHISFLLFFTILPFFRWFVVVDNNNNIFFFFILPSSFLVDFISSTDRQYSIIPISQLPFQVRIYSMILFLLFRLSFVADHKIDLDYFKIFFFFILLLYHFVGRIRMMCFYYYFFQISIIYHTTFFIIIKLFLFHSSSSV